VLGKQAYTCTCVKLVFKPEVQGYGPHVCSRVYSNANSACITIIIIAMRMMKVTQMATICQLLFHSEHTICKNSYPMTTAAQKYDLRSRSPTRTAGKVNKTSQLEFYYHISLYNVYQGTLVISLSCSFYCRAFCVFQWVFLLNECLFQLWRGLAGHNGRFETITNWFSAVTILPDFKVVNKMQSGLSICRFCAEI
jgi:hypothetical protein